MLLNIQIVFCQLKYDAMFVCLFFPLKEQSFSLWCLFMNTISMLLLGFLGYLGSFFTIFGIACCARGMIFAAVGPLQCVLIRQSWFMLTYLP